jgi:hypothetical protein
METIVKIAKDLSKKNTWVRKELERFFDEWSTIDFGEVIYACTEDTYLEGDCFQQNYCLVTGKADLQILDSFEFYDVYQDYFWYNYASMSCIRSFCNELPELITVIQKKAQKNFEFNFEFKIS